ncbi:MAG: DUF2752 domain-containing protein [Bacteroidia bacterium]
MWEKVIRFFETHFLTCYFKNTFNIECPGCGMQRAFVALLRGDLSGSLHHHPALIPFILTLLLTVFQLYFRWEKGGKMIVLLFSSTVAVMIVNYIVKLC